jgi:hypothetical protein
MWKLFLLCHLDGLDSGNIQVESTRVCTWMEEL